jgi:Fe-S cluster assembly protein SufD
MSTAMTAPLTARLLEEYTSAARALPATGPAAARRHAAIAALTATGLPSSRDENWKYTNLRPLERQRFTPVSAGETPATTGELPAPLADFARYVFVDGVFAPGASAAADATRAQLTFQAVQSAAAAGGASATAGAEPALLQGERGAAAAGGDERFALLNEAFATDGVSILVPAGTPEPLRLELLFVASADAASGASYPRVQLRLEPQARLMLIERHLSATTHGSFVTSAVAVELARGASLQHYRLQELNTHSLLYDTLSAELAQEASYRLHGINSGARAARSTLAVRLAGERAELALAVAALGDGQQVQDTFARVEHAAPRARTLQTFRGIAAGRARVAFNGKIVVAPGAQGTDSQQSLRGLLAGPEAEIDVRPQLEIYTDEVRCSHGATAGKLDENMLFYLLSRGLPRDTAQRLLKWAFLEDVIGQIELPPLRRQIEEHLAGQLRDDVLRELL